MSVRSVLVPALLLALRTAAGSAAPVPDSASPPAPAGKALPLDPLTVIGAPARIGTLPGSAHLVTRRDLERQHPVDLHRALAEVPGVTVQEEEGFGLRPNISLRGTDPERSRNITALEDGILIAPAPYASPSIHILPPVGRLAGIEILKGSSQIKYGPRTQGGVINLLTTAIPDRFGGNLEVSAGPDGQGRVHAGAGDSRAHAGYLVEFFQDARDGFQRLPDGAPTGYQLRDYLAKLRLNTGRDAPGYQEIELKVSRNTQSSHASYLGLAEADFREDPYARYPASRNDRWDSERDVLQLRYAWRPLDWLDVDAAAYRQTLEREWYKVASAAGVPIASALRDPGAHPRAYDALRGLGTLEDTLELEGNLRDFESRGIQASTVMRHAWRGLRQEMELGVRYHEDSENRREYADRWLLESGALEMVKKGAEGEKSNRLAEARAWAFHARDRLAFGRFGLVPGVRFESIELERENWGGDLERANPGRVDAGDVQVWAFGLGGTWQAGPALNLFAGFHQGISPLVPGNSDSADAERSYNYEAGVRSGLGAADLEATGFLTDYRNLLGTELAAAGGLSTEKQYNGGGVLVYGLEAAIRADAGTLAGWPFRVPLRLVYTFTHSEFRSSFSSPLEQWQSVEKGDGLPYIPSHQVAAGAGFQYRRLSLDVMGKYVGRMRTVAGRGDIPPEESAGDYAFIDASAEATLFGPASVYLAVRNLMDEVGVASRNPAGVRPTMPRTVVAGIRSGF